MTAPIDPWLPQRLRALALVLKGEQALEKAVLDAIEEWLITVRHLVLGTGPALTAAVLTAEQHRAIDELIARYGWKDIDRYALTADEWQSLLDGRKAGPALTAAAEDGAPEGDDPPNLDGFAASEPAWIEAVQARIIPVIAELFGERFAVAARSAFISDIPYRDQHLAEVFSRLKLFPSELFEEIRPELLEALSEGEGIDQIRDRISSVLDFDRTTGAAGEQAETKVVRGKIRAIEKQLADTALDQATQKALRAERGKLYDKLHKLERQWQWKARRIARTELMGAINGGSWAGAKARGEILGIRVFKQWLSIRGDGRTREAHVLVDDQIRVIDQPFDLGGNALMYPGEPGGKAELVINCRCTFLVLDEDEVAAEYAKQQDSPQPAAQVAAGPVSEPSGGTMTEPTQALPNGWRGTLAPLDVRTGDGRQLATPADGVRIRQPPRPVMYQRVTAPGHDGAVVGGRVDRVWVEDGIMWGEGPFNLASEDGQAAAASLRDGMSNGISADPDDVTWSSVYLGKDGAEVNVDDLDEEQFWEAFDSGDLVEVMVMADWRLMGATMVAFPAFDEARLEALYDYVSPDEQQPGGPIDGSGTDQTVVAAAMQVDDAITPSRILRPAPASHFTNPGLTEVTPLTFADDGRVFGHIAPFSECHIGYADTCTTAPKSYTSYSHLHLGEILTTEGRIPCGKLTLGGGHADTSLGYRAAIEHYDNASTAVAAIVAGEDEHGIWVSGRLLSSVTAEQLELLMLCPPSGDWRRIGGNLELVAVHSVNTPGFQIVRTMAASGEGGQVSLVAAGHRIMRRAARDRARTNPTTGIDYARLARELAREQRLYERLLDRRARATTRVGRDPKSRADAAAALIGRDR